MSTSTSTGIAVPADLLPHIRERALVELGSVGDVLERAAWASTPSVAEIDEVCKRVEGLIATRRVFAADADGYPVDMVAIAVDWVISDAESRIAHDGLSVDEAEVMVRRTRRCEGLRTAIEQSAVTA